MICSICFYKEFSCFDIDIQVVTHISIISQLSAYSMFYSNLHKHEKLPLKQKWTGPIIKSGKFH